MIYAIGDIHGQKAMLDHALALVDADGGADAKIIFMGDYTDRGPDSRAVIDTLIAGRDAGRNWTFLKGNHDRMFHDFVTQGAEHDPKVKSNISWVNPRLGGQATLASYGVTGDPHFTQDGTHERLTHYTKDGETLPRDMVQAQARAISTCQKYLGGDRRDGGSAPATSILQAAAGSSAQHLHHALSSGQIWSHDRKQGYIPHKAHDAPTAHPYPHHPTGYCDAFPPKADRQAETHDQYLASAQNQHPNRPCCRNTRCPKPWIIRHARHTARCHDPRVLS